MQGVAEPTKTAETITESHQENNGDGQTGKATAKPVGMVGLAIEEGQTQEGKDNGKEQKVGKNSPIKNPRIPGYPNLRRGGPGRPRSKKDTLNKVFHAWLEAFDRMGGADGLYKWAMECKTNRRLFYNLLVKLAPKNIDISGDLKFEARKVILPADVSRTFEELASEMGQGLGQVIEAEIKDEDEQDD